MKRGNHPILSRIRSTKIKPGVNSKYFKHAYILPRNPNILKFFKSKTKLLQEKATM